MYSAAWANACDWDPTTSQLVTSRDIKPLEILSFFPIHAIGLRAMGNNGQDRLLLDNFHGDFSSSTTYRYDIPPLDNDDDKAHYFNHDMIDGEQIRQALFASVQMERTVYPGWMGHLAQLVETSDEYSNCGILALPGTTPLCALLATESVTKGTPLLQATQSLSKDCADHLYKRYTHEIQELRGHMNMAYPEPVDGMTEMVEEEEEDSESMNVLQAPFYYIDRSYPNLQVWHSDPDILVIDNFLSDDECDRLIQKAEPHLIPCVTKNPRTGAVERDVSRTSTNTNVPQREVPSLVDKMKHLSGCAANQLEILQVLKYSQGQYFQPHTDGFFGPVSACGFVDSARLVTIFVYLNSVSQGGATRFPKLNLDIQPQKGRAVIHFPTTTGFEEDLRTQHEGSPAVDDKWLLATWVWMHPRSEGVIYAEENLDPLDDTII
jgi:prolyl 4-hydroxylase